MSPTTRIILNTIATYGRSVVGLAFGLFSTRWVLQALGANDLGLYGVVGSLIAFITYINTTLAGAVSRFYAFSIGQGKHMCSVDAQCELRRWFNVAVFIHVVVPLVLVFIGYPLGLCAIKNWLVIPYDRLNACIWVFRFAIFSAFVSMVAVPYTAMFQAKQLIMELSTLSIAQTIAMFFCAYKLLSVTYDHLMFYGFYMMVIAVLFYIFQLIWAVLRFKECRVRVSEFIDIKRIKDFLQFAGAKLFGSTCVIFRLQGGCVVLNKFFLPFVNAAYTISTQVSSHTNALSQALIGALQPAVVTKAGENDIKGMIRYAVSSCRIASVLVMVFIIPLAVEINEVLRLWLGDPPRYSSSFCLCALMMLLFDKMSVGYMLAANAYGRRIVIYEIVLGVILLSSLPLTYVCFRLGLSPYSLSMSLAITMLANSFARVLFCRWQLKMPVLPWFKSVFAPVLIVSVVGYLAGYFFKELFNPGVGRVIGISSLEVLFVIITGWHVILSQAEKTFAINFLKRLKGIV